METLIAARNVCAWPNLVQIAPDTIISFIFNRPSHGLEEGSIECWAGNNIGRSWSRRSVASPHEPGANRMHIAAGQNAHGALILLTTGFQIKDGQFGAMCPLRLSLSRDDGHSWSHQEIGPIAGIAPYVIPHGRVLSGHFGLAATVYASGGPGQPSRTWVVVSANNGLTWQRHSLVGNGDTNEACLLEIGENRWLAAVRTHRDHHTRLFASQDLGQTWTDSGPLTLPMQHPGHLLRLNDGRILLTYGIRNRGLMGLGARISEDAGATWGAPIVLLQFGDATDCGYPSSAELPDGSIATGYYSDLSPGYTGYHFGVHIWHPDEVLAARPLRSISDNRPLHT